MLAKIIFALTVILVANSNVLQATEGYISAYQQSPTDGTLAYHNIERDPNVVYIAVRDCDDHGKTGTLTVNGMAYPVYVFDCAGWYDGGLIWMYRNNVIVEVDWYTWQKHPELVHAWGKLELN